MAWAPALPGPPWLVPGPVPPAWAQAPPWGNILAQNLVDSQIPVASPVTVKAKLGEVSDSAWLWSHAEPRLLAKLVGKKPDSDVWLSVDEKVRIPAHSCVLGLTSDVLADMLEVACAASPGVSGVLKLPDDDPTAWLLVLKHVYPLHPRPELTVNEACAMLPIVHKYDVRELMQSCLELLKPSVFTHDSQDATYVLRCLEVADRLQLDTLKKNVMESVMTALRSGRVELLSDGATLAQLSNATLVELLGAVPACMPAGRKVPNAPAFKFGT